MSLLTRKRRPKDPLNPELRRGKNEACAATWYHQATPGTTYWRCLVPARHLPGQSVPLDMKTSVKQKRGGKFVFPDQRGEAAIWQFVGERLRTQLAFGMKAVLGTRTLLEVDDSYLKPAAYNKTRVRTFWDETIEDSLREGRSGHSNEWHRWVTPFFDGVIASTEYLGERYAEFNDNIFVCPNSIDPVDWQYEREEHEPFRIVYYGSVSHRWDTPLVTKALKWASKQPGVEVYIFGFKNPGWSFEHQEIPWIRDMAEARKNLFKFDLGIAPLKANDWANCKSDVKALEYAMAGVMPLVSKAEPFRPWWGQDQYVVEDGDWFEAIRWAVQNQDNVRLLADAAKEYVLEKRTIEKSIHLWKRAING